MMSYFEQGQKPIKYFPGKLTSDLYLDGLLVKLVK